jgi:cell division cycle protein 20 (cofactor of APC complex)
MDTTPSKESYKNKLAEQLFQENIKPASRRILNFQEQPLPLPNEQMSPLRLLHKSNLESLSSSQSAQGKSHRHISQTPERILDAPELVDDYYLNLLDWGQNNIVAIALGRCVYLWNASTGESFELMKTAEENNIVTSISFCNAKKNIIAIGTNNSQIGIWDIEEAKKLKEIEGHTSRVSAMDWKPNVCIKSISLYLFIIYSYFF